MLVTGSSQGWLHPITLSVTNHENDTGFPRGCYKALGFSLVLICVLLVLRLDAVE